MRFDLRSCRLSFTIKMPLQDMKNENKVQCFCNSYKCTGKMVASRVMKRHVQKDYKKEQVRSSVKSKNLASATYKEQAKVDPSISVNAFDLQKVLNVSWQK